MWPATLDMTRDECRGALRHSGQFPTFFSATKNHARGGSAHSRELLCANIIKYTIPAACNCMQTIRTKHNKHIFFFA